MKSEPSKRMRKYSVIIPVYNRPDEIDELLESLCHQTYKNFEVLVVEDGSINKCEHLMSKYEQKLELRYYFKENSGQGFSRNFGFERATGDYLIVFDSDCLIPSHYFEAVEARLNSDYLDAFGGPDAAHESFTTTQKAISYSMTSVFTTGGIRGNKKHVGTFHPRSFNMGISREVYESTKGYIITRMGEDIEFSIRIINKGFKTGLIEDAFVYHKRRTNLKQFYKQLHFFGRARVNINRFFPGELKAVHTLPAFFVTALVVYLLTPLFSMFLFKLGSALLGLYCVMLLLDAIVKTRSLKVGVVSVAAAFVQLSAYGIGMITELRKYMKEQKNHKQAFV